MQTETDTSECSSAAAVSAVVSISQAARLAGVDRTTINRRARLGQINKHPGGGIQIVELLRVYPDIKLPSDEPDDYEDAETPEERREALRNQVHGVPPEALTEQSKALAEMTKQLGAKDEVIAKLVLDGAAERRALLDQFDALTTKLLPAPEAVEGRPSRRTGLFRWRKRK